MPSLATALLAATLTTTAGATIDAGEQTGVDTAYTPTAKKPPQEWRYVAGAKYQGSEPKPEYVPERSPTSFDVDFFDVALGDRRHAFAVGDQKQGGERAPVIYSYAPNEEGEGVWREAYRGQGRGFIAAIAWIDQERALAVGGDGAYPRRERASCRNPEQDSAAQGGAGQARAWLYEQGRWRELSAAQGELPPNMRALTALDFWVDRANDIELGIAGGFCQIWHWSRGGFLKSEGGEGFAAPHTPERVTGGANWSYRVRSLSFLEPHKSVPPDKRLLRAYAVTAGCCIPDDRQAQALAGAAILTYDPPKLNQRGDEVARQSWSAARASLLYGPGLGGAPSAAYPESLYSLTASQYLGVADTTPNVFWGAIASPAGPEPSERDREPASAIVKGGNAGLSTSPENISVASTRLSDGDGDTGGTLPGGLLILVGQDGGVALPPFLDENPVSPENSSGGPVGKGIGGDGRDPNPNTGARTGERQASNWPDGVPDWAVGELRSSGQGMLVGTNPKRLPDTRPSTIAPTPSLQPDSCDLGGGVSGDKNHGVCNFVLPALKYAPETPNWLPQYSPTDVDRAQRSLGSYRLLELPTYALNAIDVSDVDGVGFAVGDHGAIVAYDENPAAASQTTGRAEPPPPPLNQHQRRRLPDRSAYADRLPSSAGQAGEVPPLIARPIEHLDQPRLINSGAPDPARPTEGLGKPRKQNERGEDVRQIVISRDGQEGWAIGPSLEADAGAGQSITTLYHYDGEHWSRCDFEGVEGQLPADPACAGIAGLRSYELKTNSGTMLGVRLHAAARVPLENDSDPSNDDQFEVVAVGSRYQRKPNGPRMPLVIRYREGRWQLEDEDATRELGVRNYPGHEHRVRGLAFTAPDDGWLLGPDGELFQFDGKRWIGCQVENAAQPPDLSAPVSATPGHLIAGRCGDPGKALKGVTPLYGLVGLVGAGRRVFMFGYRGSVPLGEQVVQTLASAGVVTPVQGGSNAVIYPLIVYRDRGGMWRNDPTDGGLDPGLDKKEADLGSALAGPERAKQGTVLSLSVAQRPDGGYEGWAMGSFGPTTAPGGGYSFRTTLLLRLLPGEGWQPFKDTGAVEDDIQPSPTIPDTPDSSDGVSSLTRPNLQVTIPGEGDAPGRSFMGFLSSQTVSLFSPGPAFYAFAPKRERWERLPSTPGTRDQVGRPQTLAPDNQGGFWASLTNFNDPTGLPFTRSYLLHYTDRIRKPVFTETPHPFEERQIRALAATPEGTVWAATDTDLLARYTRAGGWDRVRIPGWDPGRIATRPSRANAIALNAKGQGIAVGEQGRIATIEPDSIQLDQAAGELCDARAPQPPCGTGRDLTAAAVAPDGSALAGGERMTLLWRPAGGEFRAIPKPPVPVLIDPLTLSATPVPVESIRLDKAITGASMPSPDRAWLSTSEGEVIAGRLSDGAWSWRVENLDAQGRTLDLDRIGDRIALRAIAVDEEGHGFAVGDRGLVLERDGDGDRPWRRLKTPYLDNLRSLALGPGGAGALIGGDNGIVLTHWQGRFHTARPADYFTGNANNPTGPVLGVALLPGVSEGQAEAWAAIAAPTADAGTSPGTSRLLHYASDPDEPLLDPDARARPLPDAPAPRPGEIAFAAFGHQECHRSSKYGCSVAQDGQADYEVIARRTVEEIVERAKRPGGPTFAVFTGNATDSATLPASHLDRTTETAVGFRTNGSIKLRRWTQLVADRLQDGGVPLYGAIGPQDLSEVCVFDLEGACIVTTKQQVKSGDNLAWRRSMASRPAPWGGERAPAGDRFRFRAVPDGGLAARIEDPELKDPDDDAIAPGARLAVGGARTHYALDLIDPRAKGQAPARLIFLDTSLRSLAGTDPIQQPLEPNGGQTAWLERMLCIKGQAGVSGCTRKPDQQAIVVTSTPSYSYGPGIGSETLTDSSAFEALLMKNRASLVVSGRLGWHGRYWASAPGVHEPCPGGEYQETPPPPGARACGRGTEELPFDPSSQVPASGELAGALAGQAPPPPAAVEEIGGAGQALGGLLPFVVSSGAGGKLAVGGNSSAEAARGFWNGYAIVRLDGSGDPRQTIVEQRPIFDWVTLGVPSPIVRPGQRLTLRGLGREPIAMHSTEEVSLSNLPYARFDRIQNAGITHRYDLLEADPERPWLPRRDPDGRYVALDPSIATVDAQSGQIITGRGNRPRAYAIATLSVAGKVASFPLVFEPKRSFVPKPPAPIPPAPKPIQILAASPPPPAASQPPAPPQVGNVQAPTLPTIAPPAPPPTPPQVRLPNLTVPPAPPVPPPGLPIQVTPTAVSVAILPLPGVFPQPAPPIQPAPPSGARREARQRQAATEKSGSDSGASSDATGDLAESPDSPPSTMTARDRTKPTPSFSISTETRQSQNPYAFTAAPRPDQPSAWARGALYGGGLTLAALALAGSWAGPRPRQRPPAVPARVEVRSRR